MDRLRTGDDGNLDIDKKGRCGLDSYILRKRRCKNIAEIILEVNITERAGKIKLLILDVDGVLTDGRIILDNAGNEFKAFHVRDGQGIKLLQRGGIRVAIITGRRSKVVEIRATELGIEDLFQGQDSKLGAYMELKAKYGLTDGEIACVGDDLADIALLKQAGFPVAVNDACTEVKERAVFITGTEGGRGAVREVCETILKARGLWSASIEDLCR